MGAVALNPPVNGARSTQNVYLLDGAYNTDRNTFAIAVTPPLEAVSEYRIQTSGARPEFPQAGGGVVDLVTRTGSNQFHGNAFEFLRNEATDARGFFEVPELAPGHLPPEPVWSQPGRTAGAIDILLRHI